MFVGDKFEEARKKRLQQRNSGAKPQPAAQPLAEDRQNRFAKHDENVKAQRRDTSVHDARVAQQEKDRVAWQRQPSAVAAGGTHLTDELKELKRKEREFTKNRKRPTLVNPDVLKACVLTWRLQWPNGQQFINVEFNAVSLNNAIQTRLARGEEVSPQLVDAAYQDCITGNYLYTLDHFQTVRPRGTVRRPLPPTLFPKYVWPDEAQSLAEAEARASVERDATERQRLLAMDFADLQKQARQGFKPGDDSTSGTGGIR
jgi:hypothetical protein